MKTLVIAEKPSVAGDLARVLGKVKKQGEFYENDEYVIDYAVGHLVELFMPEDIDPKLKRWSIKNLPILPEKFGLKPIEKNKKKFDQLKKQMKRKDVDLIINACDAGREGELIFTYIYELSKTKKPSKRLWLLSMTATGIAKAFEALRESDEMHPLQDAARCRSESDWLIGINGTRAVTGRLVGARRGKVATVGRVQTPTLSLVVDREKSIRAFVPKPYWRIEANFKISSGEYVGVYQRPEFKKDENETHDRIDRIWDSELAQSLHEALLKSDGKGVVDDAKKRTRQSSPRLYDLTSLQREANGRFGFPANKTLRTAQALYEKHKMITYPRTDSRALPEDYAESCAQAMAALDSEYQPFVEKIRTEGWVKPTDKRIFNNKKISDHFAIIPTDANPKKLSEDEAKIYDMITRRFLAVFYPPSEFDETTRMTTVGEHAFKTTGKVLVVPGWLDVYGRATHTEETLPAIVDADGNPPMAALDSQELLEEMTKPPARYTEATLLAAMEGAGKFVDDDELAEAMKEKGLGTPATRAQIIEHLLREKYLDREARELIPSTKAENLIEFLGYVKIDDLTSPAMTGEWEHKMRLIEQGKLSRKDFMKGIRDMTTRMVERTRDFDEEKDAPTRVTDIMSPLDNTPLIETFRAYRSKAGDFSVYKTLANRKLSEDEVRELITKKSLGPLDGFRSSKGRPFAAMIKLNDEWKIEFVFNNGDGEQGEEKDLTNFPVISNCPHTKKPIYETPNAYIWEGGTPRVARTILGRSIVPEQFMKMLSQGKTDMLDKFKSKRTGKFFSAQLSLSDKGKIGFEFAPRAAKKAGKKAAKKAVKKVAKKAAKKAE